MGYYNRKTLLVNTLNRFSELYQNYNFEVVIANDNSNDENKIDDIIDNYNFKIILLNVLEKNWINPCVAYNLAIRHISPDTEFVVIQNPEIYHFTNILNTVLEETVEGKYISFSVFAPKNQQQTNFFLSDTEKAIDTILNVKRMSVVKKDKAQWYNHPTFRPCGYHFLNAIHINDLKKMGGFDNNFRTGKWYDDDEFLYRIKSISTLVFIDPNINNQVFLGLHQWHPTMTNSNISKWVNLKKYRKLISDIQTNKNYDIYCDPKLDFKYEIKYNKQ